MKKSCIIVIIFILICIAIGGWIVYLQDDELNEGIFADQNLNDVASDIFCDGEQTVTVDDYTITLKKTLYESKTGIGYCLFEIKKQDGKPEAVIGADNKPTGSSFGTNNRFTTTVVSGSGSVELQYKDDILYEYYSFYTGTSEEEFDGEIGITDFEQTDEEDITGHKTYWFQIPMKEQYIKVEIEEGKNIYVSPIGISQESVSQTGNVSIELVYGDGSKEQAVDTENGVGIGGSDESMVNDKWKIRYIFSELKNIEEIDYIIYNGQKYNVSN